MYRRPPVPMSYQSPGAFPCRGGGLSPLFRERRSCDCCGRRSDPARKPRQEAHRRSVALINRGGVAGNHQRALKIFALFGIPLTVYRRMQLGSGAGLQDHCHVGSIYRPLRRHERRHIHRPRHRRLLVPLLGPPSLVAGPGGSPGPPGTPLLSLLSVALYRFWLFSCIRPRGPAVRCLECSAAGSGVPKANTNGHEHGLFTKQTIELRKQRRELLQQCRKFLQNI
jgi:hypothetical protein